MLLNVRGSGESRTCPERESQRSDHIFTINQSGHDLGLQCDHKTFPGLACAASDRHESEKT